MDTSKEFVSVDWGDAVLKRLRRLTYSEKLAVALRGVHSLSLYRSSEPFLCVLVGNPIAAVSCLSVFWRRRLMRRLAKN